ncbi:MAG: serine--tRNA ligase, partial [Alphaproteobacteria bacterium]
MHDIKWIRQNPEAFDAALKRRGMAPQSPEILKLDEANRARQTELQGMLQKRNEVAASIGKAKSQGQDVTPILEEAARLKQTIADMEQHLEGGGEV